MTENGTRARGTFITVDGIEGAGKTTHVPAMRIFLERAGKSVVTTREPGGTPVGERIRDLLLDVSAPMREDAELLLVFAARAEHIAHVIGPALAQGHWVICDRFTDATFAYQGGGRGIAHERISVLEDWVQGDLRPDLSLILDLDVRVGLKRTSERRACDRFERETIAFFERVRHRYLERARAAPSRYRVIDANQAMEDVEAEILAGLASLL